MFNRSNCDRNGILTEPLNPRARYKFCWYIFQNFILKYILSGSLHLDRFLRLLLSRVLRFFKVQFTVNFLYSIQVFAVQCTSICCTVYKYLLYSVQVFAVQCTSICCTVYSFFALQFTVTSFLTAFFSEINIQICL